MFSKMFKLVLSVVFFASLILISFAAIASENGDSQAEKLRAEAAAAIEAGQEKKQSADDGLKIKSFKGGQRSLQRLNPEISVVGDISGAYVNYNGGESSNYMRSGFHFRTLDVHFQSNLDPFSLMKAAVEVHTDGVELGEAYITWNRIKRLAITLGKFRQQLGVVNRWHKHALDQYDFPLVLREDFGDGGLNQLGVSFDVLLPSWWADEQELQIQVTNGMNDNLFAGDYYSIPSVLVHMRNYWDVNRNTYIEIGLTGMHGYNNHRQDPTLGNEKWRRSDVAGADFTLSWSPVNQAKYKELIWRSEFLYVYKKISASQIIDTYGGYSYLQYKFARNWVVGARGDVVQPFQVNNAKQYLWDVVPYITWWQSPWVRLRLEYDHVDGNFRKKEERAIFQVTFAAGPHKHDKY